MKFSEWEPTYREICADMGYLPSEDEISVRMLESVTTDSDLTDGEGIAARMKPAATVLGNAPCLDGDIVSLPPEGTLIAAGSAMGRVMGAGILPDILVTDLDGDIGPQLEGSAEGVLTLILAHGDNRELVMRYAPEFEGPVVLMTQGEPKGNVLNFGGFTDGDRAVCMAREFGARRILLLGFDFSDPRLGHGGNPAAKLRKLAWAERIIYADGGADVVVPQRI